MWCLGILHLLMLLHLELVFGRSSGMLEFGSGILNFAGDGHILQCCSWLNHIHILIFLTVSIKWILHIDDGTFLGVGSANHAALQHILGLVTPDVAHQRVTNIFRHTNPVSRDLSGAGGTLIDLKIDWFVELELK